MHNGNGRGNGKRLLLIGLLILGGFWLVSDAYDDGYRDALIRSGQATNVRHYRGGDHFPWGLVIVGGIAYIAWRKGAFDRLGGPGGPFDGDGGNGGRGVQRYGGNGPGAGPVQTSGNPASGQGFGPAFRGPRAFFDEWHRQSHDAAQAWHAAPPVPPAPPTPPAGQPYTQAGNGAPQAEVNQTPPPPPPAPDYWTTMPRGAGAEQAGPGAPSGPVTPPANPEARTNDNPNAPRDASGPAPEQW